MASMKFTWPHSVSLNVADKGKSRTEFVKGVNSALRDGLHYTITLPQSTIIVPRDLLGVALIEVTD